MKREIKIIQDSDPESPREWDNLGTMVCFHSRYSLGDKDGYAKLKSAAWEHVNYKEWWHDVFNNPNAFDDADKEDWIELAEKLDMIILPLYLYDHSGITMNTTGFSCGWDSGQVGIIFVTRAKVRKEFTKHRISSKLLEKVNKRLVGEVETYDQFLTGDIYGYQLFENGEEIDSCWGFYGDDPKENGMIDHWPEEFHNIEPTKESTCY